MREKYDLKHCHVVCDHAHFNTHAQCNGFQARPEIPLHLISPYLSPLYFPSLQLDFITVSIAAWLEFKV